MRSASPHCQRRDLWGVAPGEQRGAVRCWRTTWGVSRPGGQGVGEGRAREGAEPERVERELARLHHFLREELRLSG